MLEMSHLSNCCIYAPFAVNKHWSMILSYVVSSHNGELIGCSVNMQILTCIRNVKPVMALLSHCWLGLLFHEINVYFEFKFELCPMNCQKTFARVLSLMSFLIVKSRIDGTEHGKYLEHWVGFHFMSKKNCSRPKYAPSWLKAKRWDMENLLSVSNYWLKL